MSIKNYIPNFFTLSNVFFGLVGTYFAAVGELHYAAFAIVAGIFCDFFDGFFARQFKVQSTIGLQLDSLADMVTSGVAPAIIMFQLLERASPVRTARSWGSLPLEWVDLIPVIGFAIALASAYRLARFNVDPRQSESFIGLPTPANALLILSLPLIIMYQDIAIAEKLIGNVWFLTGLTFLGCLLLNAELPLFALKFKTWDFASNWVRYVFLILVVILLVLLKFLAIPLIILLYIFLSIVTLKGD